MFLVMEKGYEPMQDDVHFKKNSVNKELKAYVQCVYNDLKVYEYILVEKPIKEMKGKDSSDD